MKILLITPYITSDKHSAFKRNNTGFGMMVYDIAKHIGQKENVSLLSINTMVPSMTLEYFNILKQSLWTVIKGFRLRSFIDSLSFLKKYKLPFKDTMRVVFQFLSVGCLYSHISEYDIVHIHGCGAITNAAIHLCTRHKVPFVITLHGLVNGDDSVRLHPSLKKYEMDFLSEAFLNDYQVSFISTGIYEQALSIAKGQSLK